MPQLYCDLDGVLVDFEGGFKKLFGFECDSVPEGAMWNAIYKYPPYWETLPGMTDFMKLWEFIKPYNPIILTGCPRTGYKFAEAGKRKWVERELGADVEVITCRSKDKQTHMKAPGDILIDDLTKNTKRWVEAGGTAIHHTGVDSTIAYLKALGF